MNGIAREAITVHIKWSTELPGYSLTCSLLIFVLTELILRTQTTERENTIDVISSFRYVYMYSPPQKNLHYLVTQGKLS